VHKPRRIRDYPGRLARTTRGPDELREANKGGDVHLKLTLESERLLAEGAVEITYDVQR
jgi:hypothetical protein